MFHYVLIKFFTERKSYENKEATRMEAAMLDDVKNVLTNSLPTLMEDALGVIALFALLVAGLNAAFLA